MRSYELGSVSGAPAVRQNSAAERRSARFSSALLITCAAGTLLAGCATQPQYRTAGGGVDPRYGVTASPRVVADGQPVPKGGGSSMVGKPYTIAGKTYYPSERAYAATGTASWYGSDFHGRKTANGEIFDRNSITAAHPTMPLPSYARVTNLRNNNSIVVRVNDRGPYHGGRVMDVSQRVAEALDFKSHGTAHVKVEYLGRASLAGSDDRKLMATLRTDGAPASLDGDMAAPVMAARQDSPREERAAPAQRMASLSPSANDVADDDTTPVSTVSAPRAAAAPLPPSRPFDLGTIPGAGVPIAAPRPKLAAYHAPAKPEPVAEAEPDEDAETAPGRR